MAGWGRDLLAERRHEDHVGDGVYVVDGFLSPDEAEWVLGELEVTLWRPSLTYTWQRDGHWENILTQFRVSETAHQDWFTADLDRMLGDVVEARLGEMVAGFDPVRLEEWQATRYAPGGKFDYHVDSGYWDGHWAGDRVLSVVLYLDTPEEGGGTDFRALDLHVEARQGRLLMWHDLFDDGTADHRVIHSSIPVVRGRKTTLVTWLRQKPFRVPH